MSKCQQSFLFRSQARSAQTVYIHAMVMRIAIIRPYTPRTLARIAGMMPFMSVDCSVRLFLPRLRKPRLLTAIPDAAPASSKARRRKERLLFVFFEHLFAVQCELS